MKKKLLLSLGLLSLPFMAYAVGAIQYDLINTSATSIPNPIKVTAGYVTYYFLKNGLPAHCPSPSNPAKVDLNTITNLPLPIYLGTESKFTFKTDPAFDDCFIGAASVDFYITQVDGIDKQDGFCNTGITSIYNNETEYMSMNIEETTDNFYCGKVSRVKK